MTPQAQRPRDQHRDMTHEHCIVRATRMYTRRNVQPWVGGYNCVTTWSDGAVCLFCHPHTNDLRVYIIGHFDSVASRTLRDQYVRAAINTLGVGYVVSTTHDRISMLALMYEMMARCHTPTVRYRSE